MTEREAFQTVYYGKKEVRLTPPSEMPCLDEEQVGAALVMASQYSTLLFSDPGAGKTLTALEALMVVQHDYRRSMRVLVVCPTIAIRNWAVWICAMYAERGRDCVVQVLRGNNDEILTDATHLVVTYGTIGRKNAAILDKIKRWEPEVLICDESDNLTGLDSNRTAAVVGLRNDLMFAWFLTGTPIPRYQDGLWPILSGYFSGRLLRYGVGTKTKFIKTFCVEKLVKYAHMRFPKKVVAGNRNLDMMHEMLYSDPPIAIRNKLRLRDKPVFSDLTVQFKPSQELVKLQRDVMSRAAEPIQVDDYGNPVSVVDPDTAKALHLHALEMVDGVIDSVTQCYTSLSDSSGVLLLFWHKDVGRELEFGLVNQGFRVGRIDGSTPQEMRDKLVDQFNDGELDILVGQIAAMGVALNLQYNCHTVIFAEDTYSDAANMQAYQRVWRRGQSKTVQVYHCRSMMPLSDMRARVAKRKGKEAGRALDGGT